MIDVFSDIVARNRRGEAVAIPSVCSAHEGVLEASLRLAERLDRRLVVEATSNQVNQFGGYTGLRPRDFVELVRRAARKTGTDFDRVALGGDHLGTQVWREERADVALAFAADMVADYVGAGFHKIHLDCSEGCKGEPAQLPDATTADRSAALARRCMEAGEESSLIFVVGTEVPPPGGARADESEDIPATTPQRALATLEAHREAFHQHGIEDEVARIAGLVVQPGVEFSPTQVHHLPLERDPGIIDVLDRWPGVCLEAHSTDYQHNEAFPRLAEIGFAFQKVGPALTFAWREAIYRLDLLRVVAGWGEPVVVPAMEALMLEDPRYWQAHYHGCDEDLRVQRHFGLADRIRYYWPNARAAAAVDAVLEDMRARRLPDMLVRQVFPQAIIEASEQIPLPVPDALVAASVEVALKPYFF